MEVGERKDIRGGSGGRNERERTMRWLGMIMMKGGWRVRGMK